MRFWCVFISPAFDVFSLGVQFLLEAVKVGFYTKIGLKVFYLI
jgi:hypothetical protein